MKIGVFTWLYKRERQPKQSDIMAAEYARGYLAGFIEGSLEREMSEVEPPREKVSKKEVVQ